MQLRVLGEIQGFIRHLDALTRETDASARVGVRSLRAIREGQSGRHAVAAESLLVMEHEHADGPSRLRPALAADLLLPANG